LPDTESTAISKENRMHSTPDPDVPPPQPEKEPPPDHAPQPEHTPIEEPEPPKPPMQT
jgi:hypothetical protein